MPQKKSYFALQLPKGWWLFGLDLALHGDIDVYQFKFFSELIKEKVYSLYPNIAVNCQGKRWEKEVKLVLFSYICPVVL